MTAAWLLAATALQAQSVTVMTYNIRLDTEQDGENRWDLRKELVVGLLGERAPDVFGIQEGLPWQVRYIDESLPGYAYVGEGREGGDKGEYSALYFRQERLELLDSGTFWLSETPDAVSVGWDAALPRICSWARFRDRSSSQTFIVANTHFDHIGAEARAKSAALLVARIGAINTGGDPVLLTGDFNAEPDSVPVATIMTAFDDARQVASAVAPGQEGTRSGFGVAGPVTARIDYVFASHGDWRVLEYAVLDDSRDGRYYSDHLPVVVRAEPAEK